MSLRAVAAKFEPHQDLIRESHDNRPPTKTMKNPHNLSVKSQPNPFRGKKYLALAAALLVPAVTALAQTQWSGGTGANDYNNTANWSGGVIPSGTVNCTDDAGSNNIILIQPGDPVFQHGDTLAGNAANTSGAWLQTGSTNNTGGGNWLRMALGTGSYGSYILSNGVVNVGGQTHIGEYGVGYLEIDGGVFNTAADPFCLGDGDWGPSPVGYMVMNGGTNNISSEFWIGEGNATQRGTGYFTMNGGTINVNFWWDIGRWGADGYFTMNNGTINKTGGGDCQWGAYNNGVASSATVNMTGGTININNNLEVGSGGNGTVGGTCLFDQSGGTLHVGGEYRVANYNISSVATNNISGNAVLIVDNWLAVGRNGGVGTMNISGNASVTKTGVNGGNITLSGDGGGTSLGTINQNGGTVTNTATQTWVAENYTGSWNLNAGAAVLGSIHLTQNAGANGTFNLNGGDLTATEITDNGGSGTFNFNGGTLHAGAPVAYPWIHDINGGVFLQAGGAILNTEGNDVTISQVLADGAGGGLTKLGAGTLTLTGGNYYTGNTVVSNGVLATSTATAADGVYSVKDNAGLSVVLANAGGQFTPATVTLGTTVAVTNFLGFDLGSFGTPTTPLLNVTGTLTVNGTTVVNIADADPQIGQFHLLQYGTKAGSGTFTLGTLPSGVMATLVNNGNYLDLDITAVVVDVWSGLASSNWDIDSTVNWVNAGTLAPITYSDGDVVLFDDTALGSTNVTLVTNVAPGTLTFANNVLDYTLAGNGAINGAAHVTYNGLGVVTMETTNGYTGATILNGANGGMLVVSNLANGGVKSPIGASTASPNNLVLNGGTLSYQGPSVTINRGYDLAANYGLNGTVGTNSGTLDVVGNLTLTGQFTAANGSSFVKTGLGTLTYAGAGTNQLSGGNDPGYQVVAGTLVFDGSAGRQVNHSQQEFWVGDTTTNGANIILTNTTLNVDSWFSLSRGNGDSGFVCTGNMYNSTMTCGNFSEGWENGRPNLCSQVFTMTNSTIIDGGAFYIAESVGSVGIANITGNSVLVMGHANPMLMGLASGATGTVVVADNSIVTNYDWLSCGANGYGTLTLMNNAFYAENSDFNFGDYGAAGTEGIFTFQDNAQVVMIGSGNGVYVGKSAGAIGIVNQSGNTVLNARSTGVFQLGQASGSSGTWNQNGGTNYAGGWVSIGRGANAGDTSPTGLYIISSGLFDQVSTGNGLIVGEQGTGTLVITNTGVVVSEAQNLGLAIGWNGGLGEVDLGGGTLVANFIQSGFVANNNPSGSATLNLNGGVLRAGPAARLNFMTNLTTATILHTTTIDTVTNTIAIGQPLLDGGNGGGLTKIGSGTLWLDGVNTYFGSTTVSAGALGGSGTIAGPVVVSAGATLAPGDGAAGTLTLGGTLSLASASQTLFQLNATNNSSGSLAVGSITYGGTLVLQNVGGSLTAGQTFTVVTAGSYAGSFSSVVSQTPGQIVTWDISKLAVNGTVKVLTATATQVAIEAVVSGGNINLSWPASQIGWQLQEQTNSLTVGLSTNWVVVPGSTVTNQLSIPVGGVGSMFFRLAN